MAGHTKVRTEVQPGEQIGKAVLPEPPVKLSIAPGYSRGCFQSDVEKASQNEPYFVRHGQSKNFRQLRAWVSDCKGTLLITGRSGTGKTTLLNEFILDLQASNSTPLYFPNPIDNPAVLLDCCLEQLGIRMEKEGDIPQKLEAIREAQACPDSSPGLVLLADEGHNLSDEVLSLLLTLSLPGAEGQSTLPVVVAGDPALGSRLAKPPLLQQASSIRCHHQILPLDEDEIAAYIQHRIRFGDGDPEAFFSEEALARVAYYSRGLPAIIKQLGDMALFVARLESQTEITTELVERAASHVPLIEEPPETTPPETGLAERIASHEHLLEEVDTDLVLLPQPANQQKSRTGKTIADPAWVRRRPSRGYRAVTVASFIAITAYLGWIGISDLFPSQLSSILSRLNNGYHYVITGRIARLEEQPSSKAPVVGSDTPGVMENPIIGPIALPSATVSQATLLSPLLETITETSVVSNPRPMAMAFPTEREPSASLQRLNTESKTPELRPLETVSVVEIPVLAPASPLPTELPSTSSIGETPRPTLEPPSSVALQTGTGIPPKQPQNSGRLPTSTDEQASLQLHSGVVVRLKRDAHAWLKKSTPNSWYGGEGEGAKSGIVYADFVATPSEKTEQTESSPVSSRKTPQLELTDAVKAKIATMLILAEEHVHADRLMAPRFDNAWAIYLKILRMDPNNQGAVTGIEAIKKKLMGFADDAISRGDVESARSQIRKAMRIDPEDDSVHLAWERLRSRVPFDLVVNQEEIIFKSE